MSFAYLFTLFMFFGGLFGGGNDLLDYIPVGAYWQTKGTAITFDSMAAEIKAADPAAISKISASFETARGADRDLLAVALMDLGDAALPDLRRLCDSKDSATAERAKACMEAIQVAPKVAAVRRLMAIRTLGALHRKEAVALLQPLLKSEEPFVAEYAAAAIEVLEGRVAPARPQPSEWVDDVWRLPASCRLVAAIAPRVAPPSPIDDSLKRVLQGLTPTGEPDGQDKAAVQSREALTLDRLTITLLGMAERYGNIRFDGITIGVSDDFSADAGYLVAVVRGRYDSAAANRIMARDKLPFNDVPGGRVFVPGSATLFALNDRMLVFGYTQTARPPLHEVIAAGGGSIPADGLKASGDMRRLLESVDRNQPIWAALQAAKRPDALSFLSILETATLTGHLNDNHDLALKLKATGKDAANITVAVDAVRQQLVDFSRTLADPSRDNPAGNLGSVNWKILKTFIDTMQLSATDKSVAGTAFLAVSREDVVRLLVSSLGNGGGAK